MRNIRKLLIFVTTAFITETFRLFSNLSSHTYTQQVAVDHRESNHSIHYGLHVIVLVYHRYKSLTRLLESLNSVEYLSDKIKVQVWIDRSMNGSICPFTLQAAENFKFTSGDYEVKIHSRHVGVYGQWLTTWVPDVNSTDIAVILEDAVTVSRHFYKYLKLVHKKYDHVLEINGYSLQGSMKKLSVRSKTTLNGPDFTFVFLYPSMGTWGFSPNNRNWRKFLDWYNSPDGRERTRPIIPGNIETSLYREYRKQGREDKLWTIWHRYYAYKNYEYTLFSNFQGHAGLSANWGESGQHGDSKGRKSNPLLTQWKREYEKLPDKVPHLDLEGHIMF